MTDIKIGDTVTWQPLADRIRKFKPMALTGAEVVGFSADTKPRMAIIEAFNERMKAPLAELTKE